MRSASFRVAASGGLLPGTTGFDGIMTMGSIAAGSSLSCIAAFVLELRESRAMRLRIVAASAGVSPERREFTF